MPKKPQETCDTGPELSENQTRILTRIWTRIFKKISRTNGKTPWKLPSSFQIFFLKEAPPKMGQWCFRRFPFMFISQNFQENFQNDNCAGWLSGVEGWGLLHWNESPMALVHEGGQYIGNFVFFSEFSCDAHFFFYRCAKWYLAVLVFLRHFFPFFPRELQVSGFFFKIIVIIYHTMFLLSITSRCVQELRCLPSLQPFVQDQTWPMNSAPKP